MGSPVRRTTPEETLSPVPFRPELLAALQADLSEEENELYEQGHNEALTATSAVVYQSGVERVSGGGAGKWRVEELQALPEEDLLKECLKVDCPSAYHKSFRRLRKKAAVPAQQRLGRLLQQIHATGTVSCSRQVAQDLCYEIECGQKPEVSGKGFFRQQVSRKVQQACVTAVRRLVVRHDKSHALKEVRHQALRLSSHCTAMSGRDARACLPLLLHAAQKDMYRVSGHSYAHASTPKRTHISLGIFRHI